MFKLSDEHVQLQQTFRDFAENEVKPLAKELDETERFPLETIAKMAEMGMMGLPVPEELGGSGIDQLGYILAVEELSKVCATTGIILSAHTSLCCWPIMTFGTPEQKEKYLKPLASGKKLGAFALTEPSAGTDASMQKSVAVLEGDHYVLNGNKVFITNAGAADVFIVFAMTNKELGTKGITAFILERDTPGFTMGKPENKMGLRASSTCELVFDNVIIPAENRLGDEGKGFKETPDRVLTGGPMMGIAQYTLDVTCIKGTNAVLCLTKKEAAPVVEEETCLRCARCVNVCPMHLTPVYMHLYAEKGMWKEAEALNVMDCIECGSCAYGCPAGIPLVQSFRTGKKLVRDAAAREKAKKEAAAK